jgi:hypothetical protein
MTAVSPAAAGITAGQEAAEQEMAALTAYLAAGAGSARGDLAQLRAAVVVTAYGRGAAADRRAGPGQCPGRGVRRVPADRGHGTGRGVRGPAQR